MDQANSSSDSTQILILRFPILRASLPPSPSLSNVSIANWNSYWTRFSSCSSSVSLFCPTPVNHAPSQVLDMKAICKSQPIKFITKLYIDHNTLWVKPANHQKTEFLRAASLSRLDNTVYNNPIFNTKYGEFFTKW